MDQKNETVSNECVPQPRPKSSPKPSLEQVQAELVRAEQQLANADLVCTHTYAAVSAAEASDRQAGHVREDAARWRNRCREALTNVVRGFAIALCLLFPRFAQAQTITIPVTVPPPVPLTVTVPPGTKVLSGGLTYTVTGTLTLTLSSGISNVTPTPTPVPAPTSAPSPTPVPVTGLTFSGYRDHNRNQVTTVAAGDTLLIGGSGFGTAGAAVMFGAVAGRVSSQTDTEIVVTVPNVTGAAVLVVNGVTDPYPLTVTPQTTLLPGAAPGDLAPFDWPPFVVDFRDALGLHVEKAVLGDTLTLVGNSFGDLGGVVWLGNEVVPTASWTDEEIQVSLDPVLIGAAPNGSLWVLQRSGGAHGVAWGPAILPRPAG